MCQGWQTNNKKHNKTQDFLEVILSVVVEVVKKSTMGLETRGFRISGDFRTPEKVPSQLGRRPEKASRNAGVKLK
jgi:hypothetical protein